MGAVNSIPVVSQVKSAVLAVSGHSDEALKVQEDFSRGCPIVSQVRSAVEAIQGDEEAARETQEAFGKGLLNLAAGTPGVGHVIAGVELALGNKEKAEEFLESANRTTAVIGGAIVAGPAGAVACGFAMDALQTGAASLVHQDYHPTGFVAGVTESIKTGDIGVIYDTALTPTLDGFLGKATNTARLNRTMIAENEGTWANFKTSTIEMRDRLQARNIPEEKMDSDIYETVKIGRKLQESAQALGLDRIASGKRDVVYSYMEASDGLSAAGFNCFTRKVLDREDPSLIAKEKARLLQEWRAPQKIDKLRFLAAKKVTDEHPDIEERTADYERFVGAKTEELFNFKVNRPFNPPDYFQERNGSQLLEDQPNFVRANDVRPHHRCAEHEAYEWLSRQRPGEPPENSYAFKVDDQGRVTAYHRCVYCAQYELGRCPTDDLQGLGIPDIKVPDHFPPDEIFDLVRQRRTLHRRAAVDMAARTPADVLGDRYMDHEKRKEAMEQHVKVLETCEDSLNKREDSAHKAALLSEVLATKGSLLALLSKNEEAVASYEKASQLATKGDDTWVHAQYGKAFCLQLAAKDEEAIEAWSQLLSERIDQVETEKEPHMTMLDAAIAHHLGMLLLHTKKQHAAAGVLLATAQRLMKLYADQESTRLILTPHAIRIYKDDEVSVDEGKSPVISIPMPDNLLAVSKILVWCESHDQGPNPSSESSGYGQIDILNRGNEPIKQARVYTNALANDSWIRHSLSLTDPDVLDAIEPGFSIQFSTCSMSKGYSNYVRNLDVTVEFAATEESLSFFDYFLRVDSSENQEHTIQQGTIDIATIDFSRIPKEKHFKACTSIRLSCESHDQGWSSYPNDQGSSRNSWTCGKVAIVNQNGELVADRIVYRNRHAVQEWQQHTTDIDDAEFLSQINPQTKVAFQIQAQYPGWEATVRNFDFRLHCVGF